MVRYERPCNVSVDAGRLNIGADDIWLSFSAPTVQRVKRCSEQKGSKSNSVLRPVSVQYILAHGWIAFVNFLFVISRR